MTSQIHLVRHAQSVHNVTKDRSQHDPPLTDLGLQEAAGLRQTFPNQDRVALVLTSPLRRALQTSIAGFDHILDKSSPRLTSNPGIENGAKLIIYPGIQPGHHLPSETGSDRDVLEAEFPGLDFSVLNDGWQKEILDVDHAERGRIVRRDLARMAKKLEGRGRRDIILVTHGMVKEFLTGRERSDWPRAGWKSYVLKADGENEYRLDPVEYD